MDLLNGESIQRLAYLKDGDVVAELQEISPNPVEAADGGPKYNIASFLKWAAGSPVLLLSFHTRDAVVHIDNVEATVFKTKSSVVGLFGKVFWRLRAFLKCLFILWKFKPTWILCAPSGEPLLASYLISRLRRIPFAHTRHHRVDETGLPWVRRLISKIDHRIIPQASAVLCHGPYLSQQLSDIGVDPERLFRFDASYSVVLNSAKIDPDIPCYSILRQKRCILYVGRIEDSKGVFDLLKASIKLLETDPYIALVYVGEGPSLNNLKDLVQSLQLEDHVCIAGHVPHSKVGTIVHYCELLVMPTRRNCGEGRPKAAIEALVLGRPIIVPDFGAFNYIVEDGKNGLCYKPDDVQDLRSKIYSALYDKCLYKRITEGAIKTGKRFVEPEVSFMGALEQGFKCSVEHYHTRRRRRIDSL